MKPEKMMLAPDMIKRIKTLQRSRGVSEDDYRALLAGYGVESCKALKLTDAAAVIAFLESLPVAAGAGRSKQMKRWDELGYREGMATPAQLRHLEGLFVGVSYQETLPQKQAAFPQFLKNKFNIWQVEHISQEMVGPIKRALQGMIYAKNKKAQGTGR